MSGVYFPLLASILPKWCKVIGERADGSPDTNRSDGVFKIIFLVSGIGMPRDSTSDAAGNSTEGPWVAPCHVSLLDGVGGLDMCRPCRVPPHGLLQSMGILVFLHIHVTRLCLHHPSI